MVEDTRRYLSTEELANAVLGSAVPTVEQRRQREAAHAAAQVLPPPPAPEPKPVGWTPRGYVTNNTVSEFAFRDTRPPTEAELERINRKSMAQVVAHARGLKGG